MQINQGTVSGRGFEPALECPTAHPESACQLLIWIALIEIFLHKLLRGQDLGIIVVFLELEDGIGVF